MALLAQNTFTLKRLPKDGLSINLGNYSQSVPCSSSGNASAAMTITIPFWGYRGANKVACTCTSPAVGATLVTGVTVSSVTNATESAAGSIVLAVASGATFGSSATRSGVFNLVFSIEGETVTLQFGWAKAVAGTNGATGAVGKRVAIGTVYFQSESETAPATPTATAFDFSTKLFTGLSEGWLIEAPIFEVGSSKRYWQSYFNVEESASGSGTGVPVFGVPKQALYLYVRELQTLPDANEAALFIGTKYAGNDPYSVIEMAAGDSKLEIRSNTTTSGYVSQAMSMRAKDTEGWNYTFGVTPEGLSFTKYKWTGGALSENRMILNKEGIEFWGTYQNDPSSFYRSDRMKLYNMFGFLDVTVGELYEDERGRIYRKHSSTRKETRTIHIGASITGTSLSAIPFTSSDVEWAIAGDLYINYQTNGLYMCAIGGAPSAQYWQYIGRPSYSASDVGAAAASHNHTKNQITDFPSSMPASDVSSWAKAASKPSYSASEVGALPTNTIQFFTQAEWNALTQAQKDAIPLALVQES